jgi:hypothetical protein
VVRPGAGDGKTRTERAIKRGGVREKEREREGDESEEIDRDRKEE